MKKQLNDTMKLLALMALSSAPVFAQSTVEKAKATGNDVKREVKKDANRVSEELCTGTKEECAKKKVKNRADEASDAVKDKAEEVRDKVDKDKK